jgi:DNA-binding Lrp family transcriptional regulator
MLYGFVMMSCDLGSTEEVVSELLKIKGVEEVSIVNGIYDIVVKISAANEEDLERTNMRMRHVDKAVSTMTLIVSKSY